MVSRRRPTAPVLGDTKLVVPWTLVTSGPLSLGIGVAGSVVGAVAIVVLLVSDRSSINPLFVWLYAAVAAVGGGLALCLGIYGFRLTREVEREN